MADRPQLKAAARDDNFNEDPFAELTRIMGFDPREPVRPQPVSSQDSAGPGSDIDLEIDLEKELMGEFVDFDADEVSATPALPEAPAVEPAAHDFDDAVARSLGADFQTDDEPAQDAAAEIPHEEPAPPPQFDAPVADDFDIAFAQSFDDEPEQMADDGVDPFYAAAQPAEQNTYADALPVDEGAVTESAGPLLEPEAVQDDFNADFERAAADADVDFGMGADETGSQDQIYAQAYEQDRANEQDRAYDDGARSDEAASVDHFDIDDHDTGSAGATGLDESADAGTAAADIFTDDFEIDLGNELQEAAVQQAEAAPVVEESAGAAAQQDSTLEDELNALLNRMTAPPADLDLTSVEPNTDAPSGGLDEMNWTPDGETEAPSSDAASEETFDAAAPQYALEAEQDEGLHLDFDSEEFHAALSQDVAEDAETHAVPVVPGGSSEDPVDTSKSLAGPAIVGGIARLWSRVTPFVQAQPEAAAMDRRETPPPAESPVEQMSVEQMPVEQMEAPEQPSEVAASDLAAPDVETVEVPERVVALADDLDIPEFTFEDEPVETSVYDDLDNDFSGLIDDMNSAEASPVAANRNPYEDEAYSSGFRPDGPATAAYAGQGAAIGVAGMAATANAAPPSGDEFAGTEAFDVDAFDYDPEFDEAMSLPEPHEVEATKPRRGLLIAAVVGAVAVVGGIGAFALSFGDGGEAGAPVLIKADNQPIKVKPENPGGTVIPNQDNKVYDVVAHGTSPVAPEQKSLVADAEEPVDLTAKAPVAAEPDDVATAAPSAKSEARIVPTAPEANPAENKQVAVVAPHKVRTMIVKPDGSLVPREEVEPSAQQIPATEPADPAPQHVVSADDGDRTGAVAAIAGEADSKPAQDSAAASSANTPAMAPVVPQRPAEQPVDIVGEVKADQVASIDPASTAAPGGWSMQIASQPSAESARSSYQTLARRYAGVLGSHSVNIVKAEIPGKGTYYRVRVPANSRNEAINLCESYKAAGGNCFVSK